MILGVLGVATHFQPKAVDAGLVAGQQRLEGAPIATSGVRRIIVASASIFAWVLTTTHITDAIAAGADVIMIGSLFAGTDEAPGEVILYQGRSYKSYRGMGSIGAMKAGSADRYFQENDENANPNADKLVPEGIEGRVPYKGSVVAILFQMAGGLRASMGYCGCATTDEMRSRASPGRPFQTQNSTE